MDSSPRRIRSESYFTEPICEHKVRFRETVFGVIESRWMRRVTDETGEVHVEPHARRANRFDAYHQSTKPLAGASSSKGAARKAWFAYVAATNAERAREIRASSLDEASLAVPYELRPGDEVWVRAFGRWRAALVSHVHRSRATVVYVPGAGSLRAVDVKIADIRVSC